MTSGNSSSTQTTRSNKSTNTCNRTRRQSKKSSSSSVSSAVFLTPTRQPPASFFSPLSPPPLLQRQHVDVVELVEHIPPSVVSFDQYDDHVDLRGAYPSSAPTAFYRQSGFVADSIVFPSFDDDTTKPLLPRFILPPRYGRTYDYS